MDEFTVVIKESSRELTKKERVKMKDFSNAIKLDEVTNDGNFVFKPLVYVILSIHNPKSKDNPDYENILFIDENGTKYVTGSQTFITNFLEIWPEMEGESDWELECYKRDSKNYKGKQFLTCSVI
ncbi:MAG: hypothetical protein J6S67_19055 [Methanobrevibacter sp.]|nr:hypothetical protein [Methanobrevibacter sp.]